MDRQLVVLALACTAVAVPALAAEDWRPQFVKVTPRAAMKAAHPKAALEQKIGGDVELTCVATKDGRLVECTVTKEDPAGYGFGEAALKLVPKERIRPKDKSGASVAGRPVQSSFSFLAPGDANPDWVSQPSPEAIAAAVPVAALRKGAGGWATIACAVTVEGFLEKCRVQSEGPPDLGFGGAGLQLVAQFRMSPKIRNGKAVPAERVVIPIHWEPMERSVGPSSTPILILDPPWINAPTSAQVGAAWPKKSKGSKMGFVALRCGFARTGHLRDCAVISESPEGRGFAKAAETLADNFQVRFGSDHEKDYRDFSVDVPFRFRAPDEPDTRRITSPKWIRRLTPEGAAAVYPRAALDAGTLSGTGRVSCVVSAQGNLIDCESRDENPAGLGFAAAALEAVKKMTMNPWSKEGDPLEGLRLTIPIQLVSQEPTPEPASEAAAKP